MNKYGYQWQRIVEPNVVERIPEVKEKGIKGGNCNRRDCQKPGAVYYNQSTRAYYCRECAIKINRLNREDALRLFGSPDLCVLEDAPDA
jgi:hypothetical protein